MNLSSAEGTALLRELSHAILEIQSGIFAVLGILLGAWLSRRSELMRLRVERRTQIFDEACRITAQSSAPFVPAATRSERVKLLEISVITLNRKIETHFSRSAYTAWRAVYTNPKHFAPLPDWSAPNYFTDPLTRDAFNEAARVALDALAKELK